MNLIQDISKDILDKVGTLQTLESLKTFATSKVPALIWQRSILPEFQEWIENLNFDDLPSARLILDPSKVHSTLNLLFDEAGTPDGTHRKWLIEDITQITHFFADLMGSPFVRLRIDRVTTNACKKFHIDCILARLICTYRGTGTQYGLSSKKEEPESIYTVPTGDPMLLSGTMWPGQSHSNLLHRSPPIAGTNEKRLVLVLDPIFDPEDEI